MSSAWFSISFLNSPSLSCFLVSVHTTGTGTAHPEVTYSLLSPTSHSLISFFLLFNITAVLALVLCDLLFKRAYLLREASKEIYFKEPFHSRKSKGVNMIIVRITSQRQQYLWLQRDDCNIEKMVKICWVWVFMFLACSKPSPILFFKRASLYLKR